MPCYFRSGWRSRALRTEGQAFWAMLVVMATVWWTVSSSTNRGPFPPKTLCMSYLLVTHDNPRWKKGQQSPWSNPASSRWCESKGNYTVWLFKWSRSLCFHLCFQPRISEIENLRTHPVITIQRTYFSIKHMPMPLCYIGFLFFFSTDSVVFLLIGELQTVCTPLLRS